MSTRSDSTSPPGSRLPPQRPQRRNDVLQPRTIRGSGVGSVPRQSFEDFELIIVDDGSTDDSRTQLQRLDDKRISLILQDNAGPSAALNAGVERALGQYIAFLSSDDVCSERRLQIQLEYLRAEQADLVFTLPQLINVEGSREDDTLYPILFGKTCSSSAELFRE